jgi:hypothetical protein
MPRGIRPRVAPTVNYGVIGSTVYSDIVQGASQLAGIAAQGKRDVADAEFRREGQDLRKDELTFRQEQAGISNVQQDRSQKLAESKFEQSVENDYYTNVLRFASEGKQFTGAVPEGASAAAGVQAQGKQLGDGVQYVTATQRFLDNSQAKGKGGTFDAAELKKFMPHLSNSLNPDDANPDFKLTGKLNEEGHIVFSADEATVANADPAMQKILSGETPVTPAMLANQLGQDIAGLGAFGKYGEVAQNRANLVYDKSRSTSARSQATYMSNLISRTTDRGLSSATTANARVESQSKRWSAVPNADIAAASAAELETKGLINAAFATLQTETEGATSEKELTKANHKFQRAVVDSSAKFNKLAGEAQNFNAFEQAVAAGTLDGSFNNDAYAKPWGKEYTTGVGQANTEATLPVLRQRVVSEGMDNFVEAEIGRMMTANPSLGRGDARNQASINFTNKVAQYVRDARTASAEGLPLAKDSMTFLEDYAPSFLDTMRLNIVTSYLPPEKAPVVKDEFAGTYE